jgi:hypothetical protein
MNTFSNLKLTEYTEPWAIWYVDGELVETPNLTASTARRCHKVMNVYPGVDIEFLQAIINETSLEDFADTNYLWKEFERKLENLQDELYPEFPDTYPPPTLQFLAIELMNDRAALAEEEERLRTSIAKRTAAIEKLEAEIKSRCQPNNLYLVHDVDGGPVALVVGEFGKVLIQELIVPEQANGEKSS